MAYLINDQTGEAVEIPEGESTVGRGPLLKITDKRVSRNHALLRLEKGKFKFCPKHKNPCFYKAVGETSFTVLSKDVWQDLHHGDLFKLLPDALIFRVVEKGSSSKNLCKDDSTVAEEPAPKSSVGATKSSEKKKSDQAADFLDELFCDPSTISKAKPISSNDSSKKASVKEIPKHTVSESKPSSAIAEPSAPSQPTLDSTSTLPSGHDVKDEETVKSKAKKEDSENNGKVGSTNKSRRLPDWLVDAASHVAAGTSSTASGSKPPASRKRKAPSSTTGASSTAKRAKAASPADESKDDDTLPSPPPTKKKASTKDTVDVGTSNVESRPVAKKEPTKPTSKPAAASMKPVASKEKEKDKKKPLCPYGTKCYRKNPIHFKEYSHDFSSVDTNSDGDNGSEDDDDSDKPVCPYGADCYRTNPAHRREYRHPGPPSIRSKRTTGSRRSTRKTTGCSILVGDSDDDGEPNTYDYNDSFIDDQESVGSSSYGGESEDSDWAPPPVAPPTGAAANDNDDDIDELLSEAKHFIANKKMRKH